MPVQYTTTQINHFWSRVLITEIGECWPWTGAISDNGYGTAVFSRRSIGAHRAAYLIFYGYLPEVVMHSCDCRSCCNPLHLRDGTPKENTADMIRKGRQDWSTPPLGSRNGQSKITEEIAREIRDRAKSGESGASLGRLFGLSTSTTCKIIRGEAWKHA